jgi:ABC-type uncharacterized transport system auxiliary subunit
MKTDDLMKRSIAHMGRRILVVALVLLALNGCLPGAKPPLMVEYYTFEYAPPSPVSTSATDQTIRVDRFSVAQSFSSTAMVYKPAPYRLASYNSNRWRVSPADMVTDYLLRDLRSSHSFRGVFSYRNAEKTRFVLQGAVEEFLEVDEQNAGKAVLSVSATLFDTEEKEITESILFQKKYRIEEPMREQNPEALARSMSAAMAKLSEQILKDLRNSLQKVAK